MIWNHAQAKTSCKTNNRKRNASSRYKLPYRTPTINNAFFIVQYCAVQSIISICVTNWFTTGHDTLSWYGSTHVRTYVRTSVKLYIYFLWLIFSRFRIMIMMIILFPLWTYIISSSLKCIQNDKFSSIIKLHFIIHKLFHFVLFWAIVNVEWLDHNM